MTTIHKTTDYDQFKFLESQRNVTRTSAVLESIKQKNMLDLKPIICNKEKYVLDGQHRLLAAKQLRVPIYYIHQ
jgi:hypothetical protein